MDTRAPVRMARRAADEELAGLIEEIHSESNGAYGIPRSTRELWERHGAVPRKRVARLLWGRGLAGRRLRRTVRTTVADRNGTGWALDEVFFSRASGNAIPPSLRISSGEIEVRSTCQMHFPDHRFEHGPYFDLPRYDGPPIFPNLQGPT
ncbi:IS3 family transposase [Kitasatospora sp. MMS16-BH015]|uniref:IS3 family transposase n=1 Tax=Kitasatospora sp. MMS16-BH015 TaxID=2018025 RepID=UPI00131A59A4|nr:IS3 family transposase [Kitasatospora sp. MMS16-BH015]